MSMMRLPASRTALCCCSVVAACATPPGRRLLLALFRRLQGFRVISRTEALAVYDSNARTPKVSNDAESGYGGPASDALARLGGLDDDRELFIVEYGCGRGALARALLRSRSEAGKRTRFIALDQSAEMAARASENLAEFIERGVARVAVVPDGEPSAALALLTEAERERGFDRFLSTYVLDLLGDDDIARVLRLARAVLRRDSGALCVAGITYGVWAMPITVYWALRWEAKRLWRPRDMGGCRPQDLARDHVLAGEWRVRAREIVLPRARPWMCSEVLVAEPLR